MGETDLAIALVAAGVEINKVKKTSEIISFSLLETGYYFIIKLCKLQVFCSLQGAKKELLTFASLKTDKQYYNGQFKSVAGGRMFAFEY